MNIKKQNQRSFWNEKSISWDMTNFRMSLDFEGKNFGIGIILYQPIYRKAPRKSFWIGITIRLLWFSMGLKLIKKKPNHENLEYFEKMEIKKELAAFYYIQLIEFKNNEYKI